MNIKIKLVDKENQVECSDVEILKDLQAIFKKIIIGAYPQFKPIIKIYGEIVPVNRN